MCFRFLPFNWLFRLCVVGRMTLAFLCELIWVEPLKSFNKQSRLPNFIIILSSAKCAAACTTQKLFIHEHDTNENILCENRKFCVILWKKIFPNKGTKWNISLLSVHLVEYENRQLEKESAVTKFFFRRTETFLNYLTSSRTHCTRLTLVQFHRVKYSNISFLWRGARRSFQANRGNKDLHLTRWRCCYFAYQSDLRCVLVIKIIPRWWCVSFAI